MGVLENVYQIVRADAAAANARADEATAQRALIQHVCDQIAEFEKRFDAHVARLAEAEDRRRADEQAAHEFEEEPLTLPPGFNEYQALQAKIGSDETHQPSGELHAIAPKEEPSSDNVGDLPEELQDPEEPVPEPKGQVYPQPTAIQLNEE